MGGMQHSARTAVPPYVCRSSPKANVPVQTVPHAFLKLDETVTIAAENLTCGVV